MVLFVIVYTFRYVSHGKSCSINGLEFIIYMVQLLITIYIPDYIYITTGLFR